MKKFTKITSSIALAATLAISGSVASTAPAMASDASTNFDSVWDLCVGLPTQAGRTNCLADRIEGTQASAAELRCYHDAGIALVETVATTLIGTKDARIIAASAGAAAVFACIKSFV